MRLQNATLLVSLLALSMPVERVEHRKSFVEQAKEAWHQSGEGRMPQIEEGFYVLEAGNVGPLHRHISSTQRFADLQVPYPKGAIGIVHTHPPKVDGAPSPGDVEAAKQTHMFIWVLSTKGVYRVNPDGQVIKVAENVDEWLKEGQ